MAKHSSKRKGQGRLGWTTGFTQEILTFRGFQRFLAGVPVAAALQQSEAAVRRGAIAASHRTDRCWVVGLQLPRVVQLSRASLPRLPGLALATPSGGCSSTPTPSLPGWHALAGKGGFAWPQTKLTL